MAHRARNTSATRKFVRRASCRAINWQAFCIILQLRTNINSRLNTAFHLTPCCLCVFTSSILRPRKEVQQVVGMTALRVSPFPPTLYSFQPTPSYGSWLKEFVASEGYDYQLSVEQSG